MRNQHKGSEGEASTGVRLHTIVLIVSTLLLTFESFSLILSTIGSAAGLEYTGAIGLLLETTRLATLAVVPLWIYMFVVIFLHSRRKPEGGRPHIPRGFVSRRMKIATLVFVGLLIGSWTLAAVLSPSAPADVEYRNGAYYVMEHSHLGSHALRESNRAEFNASHWQAVTGWFGIASLMTWFVILSSHGAIRASERQIAKQPPDAA